MSKTRQKHETQPDGLGLLNFNSSFILSDSGWFCSHLANFILALIDLTNQTIGAKIVSD
jgi:hypothetical protein